MGDDLISAETAQALLEHYDLPIDCDCNDDDCVQCSHYPTFHEKAAKELKSIAPDLARTVIAQAAEITRLRAQVEPDVRKWFHYPIPMPVTADGRGPATVGKDAVCITYEVWDVLLNSHASFDNLPDAINEAIRLNAIATHQQKREGGE